jgi:hypothetical protein
MTDSKATKETQPTPRDWATATKTLVELSNRAVATNPQPTTPKSESR